MNYLLDTNILIYHTSGSQVTIGLIEDLITQNALNISMLTKIEFLGWDKHNLPYQKPMLIALNSLLLI